MQQVALKTCENDINIELTHIDKIFCRADHQIYRYTICCAIPSATVQTAANLPLGLRPTLNGYD